jgi:hypothetical protein
MKLLLLSQNFWCPYRDSYPEPSQYKWNVSQLWHLPSILVGFVAQDSFAHKLGVGGEDRSSGNLFINILQSCCKDNISAIKTVSQIVINSDFYIRVKRYRISHLSLGSPPRPCLSLGDCKTVLSRMYKAECADNRAFIAIWFQDNHFIAYEQLCSWSKVEVKLSL